MNVFLISFLFLNVFFFLRPVDAAGCLLGFSVVADSVTTPRFGANE